MTASRISRTPVPSLALARMDVAAVEADDVLDLALALVRLRARQIDLVDDRDDLEVVLDGEIGIGQRLRLDALRRIDQQQRALARGERAGDFVAEVDVAGRVDQVEDVLLAIHRGVVQPDRMRLDGDPALALEVHRIEDLCLHLTGLQRAGELEKTIRQGRLAMIDVGDDRKIPDESLIHSDQNDHTPRVLTAVGDARVSRSSHRAGRSVADECRRVLGLPSGHGQRSVV